MVSVVRPIIRNGNGWILYVVLKGYADGQVDVAPLRVSHARTGNRPAQGGTDEG